MPLQPLDPTDPTYGLAGDGTPNTQAAFQNVLNAARDGSKEIAISQGANIVVNIPSQNATEEYSQIFGPGAWKITGAGRDVSRLGMVPSPPPRGTLSRMIRLDPGGGQEVTIADLHIAGPSDYDPTTLPDWPGDPNATPPVPGNGHYLQATTSFLQGRGFAQPTTVRIERCKITDRFNEAITIDNTPGDFYLYLTDDDFAAFGCPVGVGASPGDVREVYVTRCRFGPTSIPAALNYGVFWNHHYYFGPGVSARFESCEFGETDGNGQSLSEGGVTVKPQFFELIDCRALSTMKGYFLLPAGAMVRGGRYDNLGGIVFGGENGMVTSAQLNCITTNGFDGGATILIKSCELLPLFNCNPVSGHTTLSGCTAKRGAKVNAGQQTPAIAPRLGNLLDGTPLPPPVVVLEDQDLFGGDIRLTGSDRMPACEAVAPQGGLVLIRGGISTGDYGLFGSGRGSIALTQGSTATIEIDGHVFELPPIPGWDPQDPQPAFYCDGTIRANAITARNCEFLAGCMPFSVANPQQVEPRQATCPNSVASATIVNLLEGFNFVAFRVSGTGAISQITISNFANMAYRKYNQMNWCGKLTLISTDGFTLAPGTGPGAVAIDSAITVPAGHSVTLLHNQSGDCSWTLAD